jgi:hypothetical protein
MLHAELFTPPCKSADYSAGVKFKTGVSFSNGSASLAYSSLINQSDLPVFSNTTQVSNLSLDSLVTAPVRGAMPDASGIDEAQYTGNVTWQTTDSASHSGPFAAATVYQAVLSLSAKEGYTFNGVGANNGTVGGTGTVNN